MDIAGAGKTTDINSVFFRNADFPLPVHQS